MIRGACFSLGAIVSGVIAACGGTGGSSGTAGNGAGGSSASGGSGAIASGGSGAIASGGAGGGGGSCAADPYDGQLVPLDMFVMLDRSGSMEELGKWPAVTSALNQFVSLPGLTGLGMGIGFFPTKPEQPPPGACTTFADCGAYGPCLPGFNVCSGSLSPNDSCVASDYAKPVVPIAPLPGVAAQITSAISAAKPTGSSTPTAPALEGAIDYARVWAQQNTDHITVVVLATDGEPTNCNPNTVQTVVARAEEGFSGTPSIRTFVIGVGSQLTTLNEIAVKGGTQQAIIVSAGNAATEFLDALNAIRGSVGCAYAMPVPTSGDPDPNTLNVVFTPEGGSQEYFPKVDEAAQCQGTKSWYYDDAANPSQIILCPAACDLVTNQPGTVVVELGCKQIVR
jgi:hypothetical protein